MNLNARFWQIILHTYTPKQVEFLSILAKAKEKGDKVAEVEEA